MNFNTFPDKTAESCNQVITRITHPIHGSTEGSILVSHIDLDVCSSLTLTYDRHANMADLVKL